MSVNDIPEDKAAPMALLIFATLLYMVQSMPIYTTETCLLEDLVSELQGVVKRDPTYLVGYGYIKS